VQKRCGNQGHDEGGKGSTIPWAQNHCEGDELLRGRRKSPNNVTGTSSVQYICFCKTSGLNLGAPNFLPQGHLTSLRPWWERRSHPTTGLLKPRKSVLYHPRGN